MRFKIFGIRKPKQSKSMVESPKVQLNLPTFTRNSRIVLLREDFFDYCATLFQDQQDYAQASGVEKEEIRKKSFRDTREFAEYINFCCQDECRHDLFTESEIEEVKEGISHEIRFACYDFTPFAIDLQFEQLFVQYLTKFEELVKADKAQHPRIQEEIAFLGFAMVNYIGKSYYDVTQKNFLTSANLKLSNKSKLVLLDERFFENCTYLIQDQQDYAQATGVEKERIRKRSFQDARYLAYYINSCFQKYHYRNLFTESEIEEVKEGVSHGISFICEDFTLFATDLQFEQLFVQYLIKFADLPQRDIPDDPKIQEEVAFLGFAIANNIARSYYEVTQKSFLDPSNQKRTV